MEGDSKYLAPEVLSGKFSMKADIFSLGITLLELACDLDLPANGKLWHELRQGSLPSSIKRRKLFILSYSLPAVDENPQRSLTIDFKRKVKLILCNFFAILKNPRSNAQHILKIKRNSREFRKNFDMICSSVRICF